jgi:hypothetical protein
MREEEEGVWDDKDVVGGNTVLDRRYREESCGDTLLVNVDVNVNVVEVERLPRVDCTEGFGHCWHLVSNC